MLGFRASTLVKGHGVLIQAIQECRGTYSFQVEGFVIRLWCRGVCSFGFEGFGLRSGS